MPDALNLFPARIPWGVVDLPGAKGQAPTRGMVTLSNEAFKALALLQQRVGGANSNIALNSVLAGPSSGNPGLPTFRPLVAADLPAAVAGAQAKNLVYAGPTAGANAVPAFRALVNADIPGEAANSFQAFVTTPQAIVNATFTPVTFDTVATNPGGGFLTAFGAFQATVPGLYFFLFSVQIQAPAALTANTIAALFLNNVEALRCAWDLNAPVSALRTIHGTGIISLNGSTDFVQVNIYQDPGSNCTINAGSSKTFFQGFKIA